MTLFHLFRTPYRAFRAELVYDRIVPEVIHPILVGATLDLSMFPEEDVWEVPPTNVYSP